MDSFEVQPRGGVLTKKLADDIRNNTDDVDR